MYEELVKRLRYKAGWDESGVLEEAADAIEDLIAALTASNEVIAKNKPHWIPTTERLPYESVFVHGKGGELIVAQYSHKHKWWEDDEGYYCDTNYVTHYMPLPEPPKEAT